MAEHWWLKSEVSWVRLPAAASFYFFYFCLKTSKFLYNTRVVHNSSTQICGMISYKQVLQHVTCVQMINAWMQQKKVQCEPSVIIGHECSQDINWIKDNWISSRSNPTVYSSSLRKYSSWVTSGKRAAKRPLCGLFRGSWHVVHYTVHMTPLCALWKLLKALGRMTSIVTDMLSHHTLVEKSKDKTEHCC